MAPVSPFSAYVERKLYIHNAAHAILGYLGYRRGHQYGYEALVDVQIRTVLNQALDESSRALVAEHGLDPLATQVHVQDLLARFANRALADPIDRLARDPLRKLRQDDRLVGAARLAERHGVEPEGLATGIAAALAYDNPDDEHAVELQARLAERGLDGVLDSLCHIGKDEHLAALIRGRYRMLRDGPTW
jgi:mannitol-1-phosphate 5-dehydrogenase